MQKYIHVCDNQNIFRDLKNSGIVELDANNIKSVYSQTFRMLPLEVNCLHFDESTCNLWIFLLKREAKFYFIRTVQNWTDIL